MLKRNNQKPTAATGRIEDHVTWFRINDFHCRPYYISRSEELPLRPLQRRTDEYLECFSDGVALRVCNRKILQFTHYVGNRFIVERDGIGLLKDIAIIGFDTGENATDSIADLFSVFIDAMTKAQNFSRGRIVFIVDLAEQ